MTDRTRIRLRRIGARSVFVLFFVLYGFVGLVVGGLLFGASRLEVVPAVSMTALDRLGAWTLLLFPAGYGLLGGFVGAVAAMLYNFAATFTGGVRLELTGLEAGSDPDGLEPEEGTATRGEAAIEPGTNGPESPRPPGGVGRGGASAKGGPADDRGDPSEDEDVESDAGPEEREGG